MDRSSGRSAEGPAGGRTRVAAESAKRRAQPGALDPLEANPANPKIEKEIHATSSQLLRALLGLNGWLDVEADPICDC